MSVDGSSPSALLFLSEKNKMQLSKNFTSDEFKCPCCDGLEYNEAFINRLQVLRDIMSIPFIVTSGYRCRIYNDSLSNSATNSRHLYGDAVDISSGGWDGRVKYKFVFEAMKLGFSVGIFPTYFHIDQRPSDPVLFP